MIINAKTEGDPNHHYYYKSRAIELLTPTLLYFVGSWATYLIGLRPLSILVGIAYAFLLVAWIILALQNRPINRQWRSSQEGRAGSAELWQVYAQMTQQMRAARWVECGDTAVEDEEQETDNAVALYKHPLINLLRAPKALVKLLGFEDYYQHLQGGSTFVMLEYPTLTYSGSAAAWRTIGPKLTALAGARQDPYEHKPRPSSTGLGV